MKVSILVPVYGVEPFIEECAVSLFEQSYKDLEYIFVDDCSPDSSIQLLEAILQKYPFRQKQTRIIRHEHNRGLGAARETALAAATGDYVMFVDSDDVITTDAVEKLCIQQGKTNADIVDGALCRLTPTGLNTPTYPYHGESSDMLSLILTKNTVSHNAVARLIRKSLFDSYHIDFVEGINMAEDYSIMARLMFYATRSCIDDIIYYYRINDSGTFASGLNRKNVNSFIDANSLVGDFLAKNDQKGVFRFPYELGMLQTYHSALQAGLSRKEIDERSHYRPSIPLFRCLHSLFCHHCSRRLLYAVYLVVKRLYKNSFFKK